MTSHRVLMLTSQFLPEIFGGAEQQCMRLSKALSHLGVKTHILTSRSNNDTPKEETVDGVRITRLTTKCPPQLGGRHIGSTFYWYRNAQSWIDTRSNDFDIIHCHQAKLNAWVGVRAASRHGLRSVVKVGSAGENFDLRTLERKSFLWGRLAASDILQKTDRFVAISSEIMRDAVEYGFAKERCVLIPNGVLRFSIAQSSKLKIRADIRQSLGIDQNARVLIFVGRIEPQKNLHVLLHAASSLLKEVGRHLIVLGDGSLLPEMVHLSHRLGIGDKVHFLGRVENVAHYLFSADVFVLPSIAEGMSNAALEAMNAGLPIILSNVSGSSELLNKSEGGWIYGEPNDLVSLNSILQRMFTDSSGSLRVRGQYNEVYVHKRFSIDAVADTYCELYNELMDSH